MMIKFAVLAGFLAIASDLAAATRLEDEPGHTHELRERLGHFKDDIFLDHYSLYANYFVKPYHPDRPDDDYRNYLPSADECVVFMNQFIIDAYKIRDFHLLVPLDACLGYVFANEEGQEYDFESNEKIKAAVNELKSDTTLKEMFENTKIEELSKEGKLCIANLLANTILFRGQYSEVECNNIMIQALLNFAECHGEIHIESYPEDKYLKIISDLAKKRGQTCFDFEILQTEAAVRKAYKRQIGFRLVNEFGKHVSSRARQASDRMLPSNVFALLKIVQGSKKQVNSREVHKIIRAVSIDDGANGVAMRQKLCDHMADAATAQIKPKQTYQGDPTGMLRYRGFVDNLCAFFRSSDSPKDYDFATPMMRLVEMVKHVKILGVSESYFQKNLIKVSKENLPIYLGVSACNLLSFTEGTIGTSTRPVKYNVYFRPNTTAMVRWPNAGYY